MDRESHLYALVLGKTVAQLRQQRGLRQGELADLAGISTSGMSRIEKGQGQTDAFDLRKLAGALKTDQAALLHWVDEALQRTEKIARMVLSGVGESWWQDVGMHVGPAGLDGLVTFAVCSVLVKTPKARSARR